MRELLKQPQNSPLAVSQQIALIYTGINGQLDDLELTSVKEYCASLLSYLATSKKKYYEIVDSTNQFTDEAETLLNEAIAESKALFTGK